MLFECIGIWVCRYAVRVDWCLCPCVCCVCHMLACEVFDGISSWTSCLSEYKCVHLSFVPAHLEPRGQGPAVWPVACRWWQLISFFGHLGLNCRSKDTKAPCLVSLASALWPKSLPYSQKMLPSQTPPFPELLRALSRGGGPCFQDLKPGLEET